MKTICLFCGKIIELKNINENFYCSNCGFINVISNEKHKNDLLIITHPIGNNRFQHCFPPFNLDTLKCIGEKQKKAIINFFQRKELDKSLYDLLLKFSLSYELERVKLQKEKYENQEIIYNFFNKFYWNIFEYNKFKKKIHKIYDEIILNLKYFKINKITKAELLNKLKKIKDNYLAIIQNYPYSLIKNEKNREIINFLSLEFDDSWFYTLPLLSIMNINPSIEKILDIQKFIEKELYSWIKPT